MNSYNRLNKLLEVIFKKKQKHVYFKRVRLEK